MLLVANKNDVRFMKMIWMDDDDSIWDLRSKRVRKALGLLRNQVPRS